MGDLLNRSEDYKLERVFKNKYHSLYYRFIILKHLYNSLVLKAKPWKFSDSMRGVPIFSIVKNKEHLELGKMTLTTEFLIVYLFVLVEFKLHNQPITKYLNVSSNKSTW